MENHTLQKTLFTAKYFRSIAAVVSSSAPDARICAAVFRAYFHADFADSGLFSKCKAPSNAGNTGIFKRYPADFCSGPKTFSTACAKDNAFHFLCFSAAMVSTLLHSRAIVQCISAAADPHSRLVDSAPE